MGKVARSGALAVIVQTIQAEIYYPHHTGSVSRVVANLLIGVPSVVVGGADSQA
jgi:ABC-type phosphate transport system permease subunit